MTCAIIKLSGYKSLFLVAILALIFLCNTTSFAEKYQYISIIPNEKYTISEIMKLPFDFESAQFSANDVKIYANEREISQLSALGLNYQTIISDVTAYYAARYEQSKAKHNKILGNGFSLGSFAGYYTFSEIMSIFKDLHAQYPNLISDSLRIGTTCQNRPLYAYRLGSGGNSSKEVLITALHHAREGGGATTLIYFVREILFRYANNDPEALYLLNNRNIWLVPVVNPDGYEYNRTSAPNGGGMWRKNMRPISGNIFGVDLNRNYGPLSNWNSSYGASSTDPNNETYRGDTAFSELETKAVRDFCKAHQFVMALNYHTYSNLLVYPYSQKNSETPDSAIYRALCAEISRVNKYSIGRDIQTVGYTTRGCSDDWMYSTDDKATKAISATAEIGDLYDGFWATSDRIVEQAKENFFTNMMFVWSAGANIRPIEYNYRPEESSSNFELIVQNIGLESTKDLSVKAVLKSIDGDFAISPDTFYLNGAQSVDKEKIYFTISPKDSVLYPSQRRLSLSIIQDGVERIDTLKFLVGEKNVTNLFSEQSDIANWEGDWATEYDSAQNVQTITDTPKYKYNNGEYISTYSKDLDLTLFNNAELEFFIKWQISFYTDGFAIEASKDSGKTWEKLSAERMRGAYAYYTTADIQRGKDVFLGNMPLYFKQRANMRNFCGYVTKLRLVLYSGSSGVFDGAHLYDIKLNAYKKYFKDSTTSSLSADHTELTPFPNPSGDSRQIRVLLIAPFKNPELITFKVYNSSGQEISRIEKYRQAQTQEFPIELEAIADGVYYISTEVGGKLLNSSFVVNK